MTRTLLALAIALGACSADTPHLRVDQATPPYGPLVGGTRVVLAGAGFTAPVRVLVGGREAPLVIVNGSATLDIVIPPGVRSGDADITVLAGSTTATATRAFHYATPPTIVSVAPANILFSTGGTATVTGTGFLDEGAGDVTILVDGSPATDVVVASDTSLTFTAPPGSPLVRPDVTVTDTRGTATGSRAFRYTPSLDGGLVLFSGWGTGLFATFFDPADGSIVYVPRVSPATPHFTAVVLEDTGDYIAFDRDSRVGRVDMRTGAIDSPVTSSYQIPAMARVGGSYLAIDRNTRYVGTFDPTTATFVAFPGAALSCCGGYGIAADGNAVWVASASGGQQNIAQLDVASGTLGPPIAVTGIANLRVEDMRFFDHVLYATSVNSMLVTIDPTTGIATFVTSALGRASAMEIVVP